MDILQRLLSSNHEVCNVSVAHNMYVGLGEYKLKLNRTIVHLNSVLLVVLLRNLAA
jgi:hypothetical protein